MEDVTLNPPSHRRCVICGREDVWNDDVNDWTIREENERKLSGDRYCLHEWDITGTHRPITE